MKLHPLLLSLAVLPATALSISSTAAAQPAPAPPPQLPAPSPPPPAPAAAEAPATTPAPTDANPSAATVVSESTPPTIEKPSAPKAHRGFQIAVRTGVSIPIGDLEKNVAMSDALSVQLPLIVDVGGKIIPQLFLGAYLGLSIGDVAGKTKDACDTSDLSCSSATFRLGIQAQYHILPDKKFNPWVGYGIGIEGAGTGGERGSRKQTSVVAGWEYAHFMAGADFRISRIFGIGPVADFSIGKYTRENTEINLGGQTVKDDNDIKDTTIHEWLMIGVRGVFFP